ncbi:MAG: type II secretion system F family protein [Terracidiphilus sp.]
MFVAVLVFIGVFAVIAVPLAVAGSSGNSKQAMAALDAVLKTEPSRVLREQSLSVRKDDQLSSIPWLNKKLLQLDVASHLHKVLSQAALDWSPGRLLLMTVVCVVGPSYVLYISFHSLLLALIAAVVIGAVPYGWVMFKRSRRFAAFEKILPEALELMVSGLRAGHSLLAAIALVSKECQEPVKGEFKICFEEQNYGLEMKAALENLLNRVPLQDMKITAAAIIIQKESGGNLAEVLDKTSQVIRDRFRLRRQIQVHTAQGRLTGWILTMLPVVLGFLLYLVDPALISILWHRDIGIKMLWATVIMIAIGGYVINQIVSIDV